MNLPMVLCLECRKRTPLPSGDDTSICVWCAAIAVSTGRGLRQASAAEEDQVRRTSEFAMAVQVVAMYDLVDDLVGGAGDALTA